MRSQIQDYIAGGTGIVIAPTHRPIGESGVRRHTQEGSGRQDSPCAA
ncbi:hypothetical protein [Azospirillum argentinense]